MSKFQIISFLVVVAFASGCAAPKPHYSDDHANFLEKAKAGWSWK